MLDWPTSHQVRMFSCEMHNIELCLWESVVDTTSMHSHDHRRPHGELISISFGLDASLLRSKNGLWIADKPTHRIELAFGASECFHCMVFAEARRLNLLIHKCLIF